jgi:hypothetical protein
MAGRQIAGFQRQPALKGLQDFGAPRVKNPAREVRTMENGLSQEDLQQVARRPGRPFGDLFDQDIAKSAVFGAKP